MASVKDCSVITEVEPALPGRKPIYRLLRVRSRHQRGPTQPHAWKVKVVAIAMTDCIPHATDVFGRVQPRHKKRKRVQLDRILDLELVASDGFDRGIQGARRLKLILELEERNTDSCRGTEAIWRAHACTAPQMLDERHVAARGRRRSCVEA
eukprot:6206236-Pleurochrysis_carterae.AAC.1